MLETTDPVEDKIEEYRQRVNSLLKSYKDKHDPINNYDSSNISVTTPVTAQGPPNLDIESLSQESDQLIAKASLKIRKLKSNLGQIGPLKWLKLWRQKRKAELINTELESLIPKLKDAKEDATLWLNTLKEQRSSAYLNGHTLIEEMKNSINRYESLLDFYDELSNDCRQINFNVSQIVSELLISICFNCEVLKMAHSRKHRSNRNNSISKQTNTYPVHPLHNHHLLHPHPPNTKKPHKTGFSSESSNLSNSNPLNHKTSHKPTISKLTYADVVRNIETTSTAPQIGILTAENLTILNQQQQISSKVQSPIQLETIQNYNDQSSHSNNNSPNNHNPNCSSPSPTKNEIIGNGIAKNLNSELDRSINNQDEHTNSNSQKSESKTLSIDVDYTANDIGAPHNPRKTDYDEIENWSSSANNNNNNNVNIYDDNNNISLIHNDTNNKESQHINIQIHPHSQSPYNKLIEPTSNQSIYMQLIPPDPIEPAVWQDFSSITLAHQSSIARMPYSPHSRNHLPVVLTAGSSPLLGLSPNSPDKIARRIHALRSMSSPELSTTNIGSPLRLQNKIAIRTSSSLSGTSLLSPDYDKANMLRNSWGGGSVSSSSGSSPTRIPTMNHDINNNYISVSPNSRSSSSSENGHNSSSSFDIKSVTNVSDGSMSPVSVKSNEIDHIPESDSKDIVNNLFIQNNNSDNNNNDNNDNNMIDTTHNNSNNNTDNININTDTNTNTNNITLSIEKSLEINSTPDNNIDTKLPFQIQPYNDNSSQNTTSDTSSTIQDSKSPTSTISLSSISNNTMSNSNISTTSSDTNITDNQNSNKTSNNNTTTPTPTPTNAAINKTFSFDNTNTNNKMTISTPSKTTPLKLMEPLMAGSDAISKYQELEFQKYLPYLESNEKYIVEDQDYMDIIEKIRKCGLVCRLLIVIQLL